MKNKIFILLTLLLFTTSASFAEDKAYDSISQKYGFTVQQEVEVGFQSAISLIKQYGVFKDKKINDYVSNVGNKIVEKVSKRPDIKYRFIILDTDEINAFAAPGGFIFITKGTLSVLDNEAELAAILAHEISHVELGHGLAAISSDPALKENLSATKSVVDSGQSLSEKFIKAFDNDLKTNDSEHEVDLQYFKKK